MAKRMLVLLLIGFIGLLPFAARGRSKEETGMDKVGVRYMVNGLEPGREILHDVSGLSGGAGVEAQFCDARPR